MPYNRISADSPIDLPKITCENAGRFYALMS
jgi:hypothetical protein